MKNKMLVQAVATLFILTFFESITGRSEANSGNTVNQNLQTQMIFSESGSDEIGNSITNKETNNLILTQWGFWTYCMVNLKNEVQIAVVNARTVNACMSAGKKCAAGRPYSNIYHSTNPFLQTAKTVQKCLYAS